MTRMLNALKKLASENTPVEESPNSSNADSLPATEFSSTSENEATFDEAVVDRENTSSVAEIESTDYPPAENWQSLAGLLAKGAAQPTSDRLETNHSIDLSETVEDIESQLTDEIEDPKSPSVDDDEQVTGDRVGQISPNRDQEMSLDEFLVNAVRSYETVDGGEDQSSVEDEASDWYAEPVSLVDDVISDSETPIEETPAETCEIEVAQSEEFLAADEVALPMDDEEPSTEGDVQAVILLPSPVDQTPNAPEDTAENCEEVVEAQVGGESPETSHNIEDLIEDAEQREAANRQLPVEIAAENALAANSDVEEAATTEPKPTADDDEVFSEVEDESVPVCSPSAEQAEVVDEDSGDAFVHVTDELAEEEFDGDDEELLSVTEDPKGGAYGEVAIGPDDVEELCDVADDQPEVSIPQASASFLYFEEEVDEASSADAEFMPSALADQCTPSSECHEESPATDDSTENENASVEGNSEPDAIDPMDRLIALVRGEEVAVEASVEEQSVPTDASELAGEDDLNENPLEPQLKSSEGDPPRDVTQPLPHLAAESANMTDDIASVESLNEEDAADENLGSDDSQSALNLLFPGGEHATPSGGDHTVQLDACELEGSGEGRSEPYDVAGVNLFETCDNDEDLLHQALLGSFPGGTSSEDDASDKTHSEDSYAETSPDEQPTEPPSAASPYFDVQQAEQDLLSAIGGIERGAGKVADAAKASETTTTTDKPIEVSPSERDAAADLQTSPLDMQVNKLAELLILQHAARGKAVVMVDPGDATPSTDTLLRIAMGLSTQQGVQVLVIDATIAKKGLSYKLGHSDLPGLAEVLAGSATWQEAIHAVATPGICLFPRGNNDLPDLDACREQMKSLFSELAQQWDLLLIDAGDFTQPSAKSLCRIAGGTYLIAELGTTSTEVAHQAAQELEQNCAEFAGCIITNSPEE